MIEQLSFTVRFPPTDHYPLGRAFERSFDFRRGMTLITGPNENGKTLTLEMIEFLLFGSAALRGKAEDYKHLKASGVVAIRGTRYIVERTIKNASICGEGDHALAVGTKPVNARILQILGYGLDVFRVANVANQDDAQRLAKMKPTERKAMVDKLIGADAIENIAQWCGDQALGVSREIAGLETGLHEPVKPVKPEGYQPAGELHELIRQLRDAADAVVRAEAFLANEPVVPVVGPAPTEIPLATLDKADQILGLRTYDFDLGAVTEQLAGHERWLEKQRLGKQLGPHPVLTQAEIDLQNRRNGLVRDRQRLRQTPEILCPCGKPFTTADAEIARVEAEIEAIPQLEGYAQPDLDREQDALRRWTVEAHTQWQRLACAPPIDKPEHDPRDAKGAVHVSEVAKALTELGLTGKSRMEIRELAAELQAYQAVCAARDGAAARRAAWEQQAAMMRETLSAARKVAAPGRIEAAEQLLCSVQVYDAQVAAYNLHDVLLTLGRVDGDVGLHPLQLQLVPAGRGHVDHDLGHLQRGDAAQLGLALDQR
ncbi:AAA family ATPase [Methylorubrum populi]|uniref:AAA family ATPase n=1 Tax=Methylorubrum populi TaxID=223967 RepID=UPI000DB49684|nr:AAA family ATPase [Methylorubrum populi]PZP71757.1 MAG: hypothetical protein DI590_05710 [Methylorubrum populi]